MNKTLFGIISAVVIFTGCATTTNPQSLAAPAESVGKFYSWYLATMWPIKGSGVPYLQALRNTGAIDEGLLWRIEVACRDSDEDDCTYTGGLVLSADFFTNTQDSLDSWLKNPTTKTLWSGGDLAYVAVNLSGTQQGQIFVTVRRVAHTWKIMDVLHF